MKGIVFNTVWCFKFKKDKVYPIISEDIYKYTFYDDDDILREVPIGHGFIKKIIDVVKVRYNGEICNLHSVSPKYKNHKRYIIDTEFNDLIQVKEVEIINE